MNDESKELLKYLEIKKMKIQPIRTNRAEVVLRGNSVAT